MTQIPTEHKDAAFSPCGQYRYCLSRIWDDSKPKAVFIGLNPSTADAQRDDPTIRRCRGFAKAWGYGGLVMVNLFAFRATDPRLMKAAIDPVGPENDGWLQKLASEEYDTDIGRMRAGEPGETNMIIAAWGVHGGYQERDKAVYQLLREANPAWGHWMNCLGVTQGGYPRHPLYVKSDIELCIYDVND